jgi:tRNA (guanine37-N1)-methyltransferase
MSIFGGFAAQTRPAMRLEAITIFPEYFEPLRLSLIGKALESGLLTLTVRDLRAFTHDRHNTVDDTPYGGGAGMVMKPEPWGEALDTVLADAALAADDPIFYLESTTGGIPARGRNDEGVSDPAFCLGSAAGGVPARGRNDAGVGDSAFCLGSAVGGVPARGRDDEGVGDSAFYLEPAVGGIPARGRNDEGVSDPVFYLEPTTAPTPSTTVADEQTQPLPAQSPAGGPPPTLIFTTPAGEPFTQAVANELAGHGHLVFACGRYEGIDQRVVDWARGHFEVRELSLGDYVLNGGEVAALAMIEAIVRLVPGVIGNPDSLLEESHGVSTDGLLEYPSYTKPAEWRGFRVPEVLLSGNHGEVAKWRRAQSEARTAQLRPDLIGD